MSAIARALERARPTSFTVFAGAVAFIAYFSMYAFRKPYGAATFDDTLTLFGVAFTLKTALVISQTLGYAASKFLGIKFITELPKPKRAVAYALLICIAEAALLAFAVVPKPFKLMAMALNGLPLGMVWGLVFSFLEGRRTSDALGAILSASFILASGAVKSVGAGLLALGVSEAWMPVSTGALFLPFIFAMAWVLSQIPPPSAEEERLRTRRQPMTASERHRFFAAFAPGLIAIIVMAMVLTALRDMRDNFAREIWDSLGYTDQPGIFGLSELIVTVVVLVALGAMVAVKRDRNALLTQFALMTAGVALIGLATFAFDMERIGGLAWMILLGVGLFTAYVPAGCFLFDRMIGATHFVGTAVFMIYVTDAVGYASSVVVMLYREFFQADLDWLAFLRAFAYIASVTGVAAFGLGFLYFARRTRRDESATETSEAPTG